MVLPINTPVLAGTLQPLQAPLANSVIGTIKAGATTIGNAISSFFSSKDTGAKIAKIGVGVAAAGAGIGIGANAASAGVGNAGKQLSKDFDIPVTWLAIAAIVIIVLFTMRGKGRR